MLLPRILYAILCALTCVNLPVDFVVAQSPESAAKTAATASEDDVMRALQTDARTTNQAPFGHWGSLPNRYSTWTNHSNRLIPIYTFGISLDGWREEGSVYRDETRLKELFAGTVPTNTVNPKAAYFDQTDVYRLQQQAIAAGKRHVILMVFDGMDWDTTRAAAIYKNRRDAYDEGRGTGLRFQDYRGTETDFGFFVTTPLLAGQRTDVNAQVVLSGRQATTGGYNPAMGGETPWAMAKARDYLTGMDRTEPHTVTDSASSATSMVSGIKTYNGAINFDAEGNQIEPLPRRLQRDHGFSIGVVSSVPISHATPAAAYANNVARGDYQDISRDLLGLPSSAHRAAALPGVEVLLGGGWGEQKKSASAQGDNYIPGNPYVDEADLDTVAERGVVVARRTPGVAGVEVLTQAAEQAIEQRQRLVGLFGVAGGHLPFQTADGKFNPTVDVKAAEHYTPADVHENPTVADMTTAALRVLEQDEQGFWLMVEAGDVDWANHANNLDNAIGAVFSGEAAFTAVVDWVESRDAWDETAVILTADHGHYFVLTDPAPIANAQAAE